MKKIVSFIAILMMVSTAANAQLMTSNSSSKQIERKTKQGISPYNKLVLTYSPLSAVASYDGSHSSESGFNAIGLTYMHGSLLAKFPLYLEFGGGAQYTFYSKDNLKVNMISVNIPVNVLYRFAFNNGKIHLAPFTGLYGRVNVWGESKSERSSGVKTYDLFGDDDDCWRRFQLGWSVGAQFDVSKFYIHVAYLTDVTNVSKESDVRSTFGGVNFGIGLVF